jgi:hypothetical protein
MIIVLSLFYRVNDAGFELILSSGRFQLIKFFKRDINGLFF